MAVRDAKTNARARATPPLPGRRRRRTAGDLEALRRELWHGLRRVGEVFDDHDAEPAELCKAANSLAALANAYRGVTEAAELVPRLEAIEARLASERGGRR